MGYNYQEKKIVAVLSANLTPGVALNILGHLAMSIGHYARDHMGREFLVDASGVLHRGIARYPLIITKVKANTVRRAIEAARMDQRIIVADFPQQMLDTGHDDELAQSLAVIEEEKIGYLGAVLYGPSEAVDLITRKYSLWKP